MDNSFQEIIDQLSEEVSTKGTSLCIGTFDGVHRGCLLYTSPSPRDAHESRMPSSA